ncbi:hypothetical protein MMC26_007503 [Xylographa opegraphella]|nr:hypothetical protein [Xylographa opegraphella]
MAADAVWGQDSGLGTRVARLDLVSSEEGSGAMVPGKKGVFFSRRDGGGETTGWAAYVDPYTLVLAVRRDTALANAVTNRFLSRARGTSKGFSTGDGPSSLKPPGFDRYLQPSCGHMEDQPNHCGQSRTGQTMVESSDTMLINSLRMMREAFFWEKSHLPAAESQRLWSERVSEINSVLEVAPPPPQPPVDLSHLQVAHSAVSVPTYQFDVAESQSKQPRLPALDRTTSRSQQSLSMSRKRSNLSSSSFSQFTNPSRDTSQIPIQDWQANTDEPFSSFKMQRTASGRKPLQRVSELTVCDPEEYLRSTATPNNYIYDQQRSSPRQIPQEAARRLSQSSGQQSPCSNRFSFSQSPTTQMSRTLTDATTLSHGMSRQDSYANSSMCGGLQMMKIHSQRSNFSDFFPDDHSSLQVGSMQATNSDCGVDVSDFDRSHLLYHTGGVSQNSALQAFPVPFPVVAAPVLSFPVEDDHDMKRSTSKDGSTLMKSRMSRRREEQLAQSGRPIAPKLSEEDLAPSRQPSTSDHQMIRIKSADGSSKELMAIARNNYSRPQKEKVRCKMCNKRPDGFRGEHELHRHYERHHCESRKVWVCVDNSEDKTRLAKCKACCAQKEYGAYYNAAAHLRRVHFHPRPKGRKVKGSAEEKRGGKGGGDSPSMEFLKSWMEEREVFDFDKIDETIKQQLFADFDKGTKWQPELHHGNNEIASDEDVGNNDNYWGSLSLADPEPDHSFKRLYS